MDSSGEKRTVTLQTNPLLINAVIKCVLEYLPLEDLKQCRAVCQEWNSESIKILNNKATVKLDSKERITHFLEFYKGYDTQAFPFTTFDLQFAHTNGNTEEWEQLIHLFNTLRENIITLTFANFGEKLNLTPLIDVATNVVRLTLFSCESTIELDNLRKVKHLSLINCHVSLDSFENRIAPLSISLNLVSFNRNNNRLNEILINDYIDFSLCSEINISLYRNCVVTFDLSRDIVSALKVGFHDVRVINWRETPENVHKSRLPFEKHIGMGIKKLHFSDSELNLSVLPKSLEKLKLTRNTYSTNNCVPIELPKLKFLYFQPLFDGSTAIMSPAAYDMGITVSMFRLCPKLTEMELKGLWYDDWRCDINVDLLPVTLKKIKLMNMESINFVGDTVSHVDILILDKGTFADAQKSMSKIKPKILLMKLQWQKVDPTNEVVSFVEESRNLEKMVIEVPIGEPLLHRSYKESLSSYVENDDEESKYYEFTNQVGKRLTKEEFKMYWF